MVAWISLRLASGQVLNSSGGMGLPSRAGASAKPIGVRRMTMFFAAAFSCKAAKASRLLGLESLIDGAAPCLVIFAFEYCRQCRLEIVDERSACHRGIRLRVPPAIRWPQAYADRRSC